MKCKVNHKCSEVTIRVRFMFTNIYLNSSKKILPSDCFVFLTITNKKNAGQCWIFFYFHTQMKWKKVRIRLFKHEYCKPKNLLI
jgi:hypothetical protein